MDGVNASLSSVGVPPERRHSSLRCQNNGPRVSPSSQLNRPSVLKEKSDVPFDVRIGPGVLDISDDPKVNPLGPFISLKNQKTNDSPF